LDSKVKFCGEIKVESVLLKKKGKIKVNIVPNEILLPNSKIKIEVDIPLNSEYVQDAIIVHGINGVIRLSDDDRIANWEPIDKLTPGNQTLIVGELISKAGEKIFNGIEVPFFVTDSVAKIPSELRVENMVRLRINSLNIDRVPSVQRVSGEFIEIMKASNRETNEPIKLAFDERGEKIDSEKIFAEILKNRIQKFGKIHESLDSELQKVDENTPIEVAIWFKSEKLEQEHLKNQEKLPSETPKEIFEYRKRLIKEFEEISKQIEPIIDSKSLHLDSIAPVIYTTLTENQISEIKKNPNVLSIFLHETLGVDDLDDSIAIANSDDVHDIGYEGSGIKVAVWENGPDITNDLVIEDFYDQNQTNTSDHARHTHGIIKNKEKKAPNGHAPKCKLFSANDKALSALRWAVKDELCTVISQSFHRSSEPSSPNLSYDDIYKDWLVINYPYPTILQAAGNYWSTDPDNINPPSSEYVNHKGYNSLAVGNHNDNASALSGSTVFRNPDSDHGDRELPEICANGTSVTAVNLTKSGTSMAAPAVAGCTALIQEANFILSWWPEGCRAILLAGAKRNVAGDSWWQDILDNDDAADGTGSLDGYDSVKISLSRQYRDASPSQRGWDVGTLRSNDFDTKRYSKFSYKIQVPKGWFAPRHVKVALAWNSEVGELNLFGIEIPLTSKLTVDFDLRIYDSNGNLVSYSLSWDNSYEIAEFIGKPGEIYTVRIHRWSGTHESWYGIAWTVTGGLKLVQLYVKRSFLLDSLHRLSVDRRIENIFRDS